MEYRLVYVALIFLISNLAWSADNCSLADAVADPKIASNPEFWEDYAKLTAQGDATEAQIFELTKKYKDPKTSNEVTPRNTPAPVNHFEIHLSKQSSQDLKKLRSSSPQLQKAYDEFLGTMSQRGIQEIRNNPGRWRLEKLNDGSQTVRLNGGVRVNFRIRNGNQLEIIQVNADKVHGI